MDEKKSQEIQVHPLTRWYTYYHMWIWYNYFDHNGGKWCVATCFNIELCKLLLLLFWNNVGCSIQMLGWSYIMTHGLM